MELIKILSQTNFKSKGTGLLLAGILAGGVLLSTVSAQTAAPAQPAAKPIPTAVPRHYRPDPFAGRAGKYYPLVWGVDSLSVKAVESGALIRFTYRIVDPNKATVFNDKKLDAFLDSPSAHARLVIPTIEKVGQLRQYNAPEAGTSYWMAFSNPRKTVKRGDHVNVVIGNFHADGLVVE
jgi:hypothetical protein